MAEAFLKEQLKRIRKMTDQMSRARESAAELNQEFERDRASISHGPLGDNRDLRSYDNPQLPRKYADDHVGRHKSHESRRRHR